jgi:hypothetical protein
MIAAFREGFGQRTVIVHLENILDDMLEYLFTVRASENHGVVTFSFSLAISCCFLASQPEY